MLSPESIDINPNTGVMEPATGRYLKKVCELGQIYQDKDAFEALVAEDPEQIAYEVIEYRKAGSDLFFGTTTMRPGKIGREYFMTRGHYHKRRDLSEIYYTQSGSGILLLQSRQEETKAIEMRPGICAYIPPDWAHRSINTGSDDLVFVWCCDVETGHDYGEILDRGMAKLVVEQLGEPLIVDNPSFN